MTDVAALPLLRRPDLEVTATLARGERRYTIKDPLGSRSYQLREEEFFVLEQLSAPLSWRELVRRLSAKFAPRKFTPQQLEQFLHTLVTQGLVRTTRSGMGQHVWDRAVIERRKERAAAFSPLAIRFRGWNPGRDIDAMLPWTSWLFSIPAAIVGLTGMVVTLLFALARFQALSAALPTWTQWLTPSRAIAFAIAIGATKVAHELGHAIACRRIGGRCRELGVMLLVGVPCLYCNVSDTWMEPNKWRRMSVSVAGIWIEWLMALPSFWLWWLAPDGWLGQLGLTVAVVCSINTLLFNGNPLLRYDGYHVLADYLEIPNLYSASRQRVSAIADAFLQRLVRATDIPISPRADGPDWLLVPYALLSMAYRVFAVFLIWFVTRQVLEPAGLEAIAHLLLILALMASPVAAVIRRPNKRWAAGLAAAAIGGILWIPLPGRVDTVAVLLPKDLHDIRILAPGRLVWSLPTGSPVIAGQEIARIQNLDYQRALAAIRGEVDAAATHLESLQSLAATLEDEESLLAAQQKLETLQQQARALEKHSALYTVRASRAGVLLPPAESPSDADTTALLEKENQGAEVYPDDRLGCIADLDQWEAFAAIPQSQIDLIDEGQHVWIAPHGSTDAVGGEVIEISEMNQSQWRPELAYSGAIAQRLDEHGNLVATETWFEIRIRVLRKPSTPIGGLAEVRVRTNSRSLWQRLRRSVMGLLSN